MFVGACGGDGQAALSVEAGDRRSPSSAPDATPAPSSPPEAGRPVPTADAGEPSSADATDGATTQVLEWKARIAPGFEGQGCAVAGPKTSRVQWLTAWHVTRSLVHHVNLWLAQPGVDLTKWCLNPLGGTYIFDASQPDFRAIAPAGGAIRIPAGVVPVLDIHEINTGTEPGDSSVHVDLSLEDEQPGPEVFPGSLNAANFAVQAGATTTLTWSCPVPAGVTVAWVSSHTHSFTTLFTLKADSTEVYRSTTWSEPPQKAFDPPLAPKTMSWSSTITNTTAGLLRFGTSRDHNEMSSAYLMTLGARVSCTKGTSEI